MERAECKTTNGESRRATPDAPERIDHPRRCTGHGRRTPDGGSRGARPYSGALVRTRRDVHAGAPERHHPALPPVPRAGARPYRATRAETRRDVQRHASDAGG